MNRYANNREWFVIEKPSLMTVFRENSEIFPKHPKYALRNVAEVVYG
jgi:ethanolamine utilization cobalamin adenosyltransferase